MAEQSVPTVRSEFWDTTENIKEFYMSKHERILIHKAGEEGGFFIEPMGNGDTAKVLDDVDLPDWASNDISTVATADLKERRDWYIERIGEEGFSEFATPEAIDFSDLKWTAADEAGDLVDIEPDYQWRAEHLAEALGLDTSVEAFDAMEGTSVESTYKGDAEGLATLEEGQQQSFNEKTAANG